MYIYIYIYIERSLRIAAHLASCRNALELFKFMVISQHIMDIQRHLKTSLSLSLSLSLCIYIYIYCIYTVLFYTYTQASTHPFFVNHLSHSIYIYICREGERERERERHPPTYESYVCFSL